MMVHTLRNAILLSLSDGVGGHYGVSPMVMRYLCTYTYTMKLVFGASA